MDDLRRIHYVAEHYRQLQGLRLLPLSVPFLLSGAGRVMRVTAGPGLPRGGWAALTAVALASSVPIGRYYARRFGEANTFPWRTGLTLIGSLLALLTLEWTREAWHLSVSLPILFVAIVLARLGLAADRLRVHYLWIAAACAAYASLPPLGVALELRAAALDLLVGGGLAVAAIGDDRVLRRTMARKGFV